MNGKKKYKIDKLLLGSPEMGLPIQPFPSQDMVMGNPEKGEESHRHFRNLVEKAPFPICILKGEEMVLEVANDSVFKIWHVGSEALGKPFLEIKPEMKGQPFMEYLLDVLKKGITHYGYEEPAYFIKEDGQIENAYFNFVYQPYFELDGSISGVMVSAFDVTQQVLANKKTKESESYFRLLANGFNSDINDQKIQKEELEQAVANRTSELKDANEKLQRKNQELEFKNKEVADAKEKLLSEYSRSLIEASLDPFITLNTEGVITDMNEAFGTITGETREQLIGSDFGNYFTDPQKAREVYKEVFAKGFVSNYPLTIIDGELTDVLFNGSVYKDDEGNVLGAVVVARVITEMKKVEKELVEAKVFAELATLVAEEAQSKAESATLIAEEAVKSKQQFLSNMSHEIRTPMNAIIGFTKVALKTDLSPKQKEYLNAIKMSGDTLIVLINDILDLAKVDAGKMNFEKTPFKMAASINAMLHLFETKIQEKNLEFIKEYDDRIPHVLEGDPVRLHQIIMNLVSNAVKFTSEGRITVSVRMLNEDAQYVTIEFAVADTGIGISKDNLEKIFENFHQASSDTSRLFGGTGLGLNIAKQLVEKQGGSIHVKSKMTEGSTFSFILTFQKTNAAAAFLPALMELDNDLKNIKVLVVEDMALNQLLMKTLLDDFGFERDIANNGKIAIEKLTQKDEFGVRKAYDVILMDLQMPEMNGFEATAYIRNILHSKIPIIALTADVTTADLARCKAVGMDDYISKPVDEKLLYTKIVNLVKKPADIEAHHASENTPLKLIKYTDLGYLVQRTKNNPAMIAEMIEAFLEQTPPLVSSMKKSLLNKDWDTLHGAVHKMIPSFAIMGMSADFENMAKKIQDSARSQQQLEDIHDMVTQLENACMYACKELEVEFKRIKSSEA